MYNNGSNTAIKHDVWFQPNWKMVRCSSNVQKKLKPIPIHQGLSCILLPSCFHKYGKMQQKVTGAPPLLHPMRIRSLADEPGSADFNASPPGSLFLDSSQLPKAAVSCIPGICFSPIGLCFISVWFKLHKLCTWGL